jgi:hypothetical protein
MNTSHGFPFSRFRASFGHRRLVRIDTKLFGHLKRQGTIMSGRIEFTEMYSIKEERFLCPKGSSEFLVKKNISCVSEHMYLLLAFGSVDEIVELV